MIRTTTTFQRVPIRTQSNPTGGLADLIMGSQQLYKLISSLEEMQTQHQMEHQAKMSELDSTIAHVKNMQKGDPAPKPIAGVDYPIPKDGHSVKHEEVVADVLKKIRQPKDGETPVVDYKKIAQIASQLIEKPKDGKDAKALEMKDILEEVKKNLKVEHIPGLKGEIDSYRNQLAGKIYGRDTLIRGGGDTVTAGSNVTITKDANGNKTISVLAAGGAPHLPSSGVVNGINNVFVGASAPNYIVIDGATYMNGDGYSLAGTTVTTVVPPTGFIYLFY